MNWDWREHIKKKIEEQEKQNPPDFTTHYNYVNHLKTLSENLSIGCNINIRKKISDNELIYKKIKLSELTNKSIKAEYDIISKNPDYALVCASWISVKSYYLLFNMIIILQYLITDNENVFSSSHTYILNKLKEYIKEKKIEFNKREFNDIYVGTEISKWKFKSGENIKFINYDDEQRFRQIINKLFKYQLEEFQRIEKIKHFRCKKNRNKKEKFISNSNVNICEFFYWYRIKANYRDLEFLDKNISSDKFKEFYCDYYALTKSFYKAFEILINQLSEKRLGKKIL